MFRCRTPFRVYWFESQRPLIDFFTWTSNYIKYKLNNINNTTPGPWIRSEAYFGKDGVVIKKLEDPLPKEHILSYPSLFNTNDHLVLMGKLAVHKHRNNSLRIDDYFYTSKSWDASLPPNHFLPFLWNTSESKDFPHLILKKRVLKRKMFLGFSIFFLNKMQKRKIFLVFF